MTVSPRLRLELPDRGGILFVVEGDRYGSEPLSVGNQAGIEPDTAVSRWFGVRFCELHPLLQQLHRNGGTLSGEVEIRTGSGLAGWIGRRLARSIGIPVDQHRRGFEVSIRHEREAMNWVRRFDNGVVLTSRFAPIGTLPDGYWIEDTGPLSLYLTVDIVDGGWEWRPLRARFAGVPVPLWLLPRSRAGKRIENGRYVFRVEFSLPVVGMVLSYSGTLMAACVG